MEKKNTKDYLEGVDYGTEMTSKFFISLTEGKVLVPKWLYNSTLVVSISQSIVTLIIVIGVKQ